jgi:O-antigen/teichoic acid export membrane protein
VSIWNPWLPASVRHLAGDEWLVPAFVLCWVLGSMLDLIGTAEERVPWQTKITVGLSVLRAAALCAAALITRQLEPVLLALLGFVAFKVVLLLFYVARHHGLRGPFLRRRAFAEQLRQSVPFGVAGALYGLRAQADQWVATALFSVGMFAAFSIGALLAPLVHVCRQSVLQAFLPSISRLEAAGDYRGMLELNSRGNVLVATLVYPLLAFAFVFSADIVTIVYTAAYVAAAPVMRIYILGLIVLVVELASVMLLLRQGRFSVRLSMVVLAVSVAVSWLAAHTAGLAGAAAGSVTAIYLDHAATLWRISRCTGIPVRRLQDWRSLALLLLCAALAGLLSWWVVHRFVAGFGPEVRIAAGAVVLATGYFTLVALGGLGRHWRAALEGRS